MKILSRIDFILVFFIFFTFYLYYQRVHPLFGDEFNILVQAGRVLDGQVPYRDFFQFVTPGSIYLSAVWLKIAGKSIWSIRVLSALEGAVIALFVYLVVKKITQSRIIIAIVLLFTLCFCTTFWPFVSHHWLSTIPALFAIYFMSNFIERRRTIFLLSSGFFAGITFIVLQNKGTLIFIALILFLSIDDILLSRDVLPDIFDRLKKFSKNGVIFFVIFILPLLILVIYLLIEGAINDFIYDTFIWVLGPYRRFNAYPNYFYIGNYGIYKILTENPFPLNVIRIRDLLLIGYLPPLLVGLSVLHLIKMFNRGSGSVSAVDRWILLFILAGIFMFFSVLYRSDQVHITFVLPFIFLLFAIILDKWLCMWRDFSKIKRIAFAVLLLFFLFYGAYGTVSRIRFVSNFRHAVDTKIGRFYTYDKSVADFYDNLFRSIEEKIQEDKVFVYLWSSFVYYIFGKNNPTRFDSVIPGYNTDEQLEEIAYDLERNGVNYIFYDSLDSGIATDPFGYSYPLATVNLDNPLNKYISENFEEIFRVNYDEETLPVRILRRQGELRDIE